MTTEVRFFFGARRGGACDCPGKRAEVDADGRFVNDYVSARKSGEFILVHRDEIELMDVWRRNNLFQWRQP